MAGQRGADGTVGFGKSRTSVVGSVKLRSNRAFRRLDRGRTNDQNRRHRHARLDWRVTDFVDQRGHPLGRGPGVVVRVGELKVVGPEHQNDERQWRVDLDTLRQTSQAIPAWFERIFPDRAPPIQTVLDHPHPPAKIMKAVFEYPRPPFVERQSPTCVGNNPPSERVRVHENVAHKRCPSWMRQSDGA